MLRQELVADGDSLLGLTNINVILGRNGSGKSKFLRSLEARLTTDNQYKIRYISPERTGVFRREGHVETNMAQSPDYLRQERAKNQAASFKAVSAFMLQSVESLYNRRVLATPALRNDNDRNFENDRLERINRLLTNITLNQIGDRFVFKGPQGEEIPPDQISSGESEAVSLATEILYFFELLDPSKFNVLLMDEPDVHLHPDLQARLANLIISLLNELNTDLRASVAICICTHSTALVCALAGSEYTSIGNKEYGISQVTLSPRTEHLQKVAPFFGHPLSLALANDRILILEGEDDERIWQHAARRSEGRIKLFPVLSTSVDRQSEVETFCAQFLPSIYDHPEGFSLRDGDGIAEDLTDVGVIKRFRLHCYAAENLLLTDESLETMGTNWEAFKTLAQGWIAEQAGHIQIPLVTALIGSADRLRNTNIKPIRLIIPAIAKRNKPWEVIVGQSIGALRVFNGSETSIISYLSPRASAELLGIAAAD